MQSTHLASTDKKTVLVIIGVYLPGTLSGGPVRTTSNMVEWLGDNYNFLILTANHDFGSNAPYPGIEPGRWYPVGDKSHVRYLTPGEQSLRSLAQIVNATPHDMVYLNSVLATLVIKMLVLRRMGRLPRVPVMLAPRGALEVSALKQKIAKKRSYLAAARLLGLYRNLYWHTSNDTESQRVVSVFNAPPRRIKAIPNLPDPRLKDIDLRTRSPKQDGVMRLVSIARILPHKNMLFVLQTLSRVTVPVDYDIYGPIEDAAYWARCQQQIVRLPEHVRVNYCGMVAFDDVPDTLVRYDLFALPTLSENFGHSILEALCAGCPVLISDQTPWRDLQVQGAGWDLPLDDVQPFVDALEYVGRLDEAAARRMSAAARRVGLAYLQQTEASMVQDLRAFFDGVMRSTGPQAGPNYGP